MLPHYPSIKRSFAKKKKSFAWVQLEYQKKLQATQPSNYKGKVSEETEDIIIKRKTKNSLEYKTYLWGFSLCTIIK